MRTLKSFCFGINGGCMDKKHGRCINKRLAKRITIKKLKYLIAK